MFKYIFHGVTSIIGICSRLSKIEVPRDGRNSKSGNTTSSGENGLNIRTNASPNWDRTRCPEK